MYLLNQCLSVFFLFGFVCGYFFFPKQWHNRKIFHRMSIVRQNQPLSLEDLRHHSDISGQTGRKLQRLPKYAKFF